MRRRVVDERYQNYQKNSVSDQLFQVGVRRGVLGRYGITCLTAGIHKYTVRTKSLVVPFKIV
jgi:hypothetical protein